MATKLRFLRKLNITRVLLASILYDSVFIVTYINLLTLETMGTAFLVSLVFGIKKFLRVVLDMPVGALVDGTIGPKNAILLGIVFKFAFIACLFQQTKPFIFASAIFESLSLLLVRGKISVLQYKVMESHNEEKSFPILNSVYNLGIYSFTTICSILAEVMRRFYGMQLVVFASLILTLLIFALISGTNDGATYKKLGYLDIKSLIMDKKSNVKKVSLIVSIKNLYKMVGIGIVGWSVVLGLCSLGWQLNTTNQLFALKVLGKVDASRTFQMGTFCMLAGAVISIFATRISVFCLSFLFVLILLICSVMPIFLPVAYIKYLIVPYLLFFTTFDNALRSRILATTSAEYRCFVSSIATTVTSLASIVAMYAFMFIGDAFGYVVADIATYLFVFALSIIGLGLVVMCKQKKF